MVKRINHGVSSKKAFKHSHKTAKRHAAKKLMLEKKTAKKSK